MRLAMQDPCRIVTGILTVALMLVPAAARSQELDSAPEQVPLFGDTFESGNVCNWSSGAGFPQVCPYNFFCAGAPAPTSAADPLMLTGALTDFLSGNPIGGATVEARRQSGGTLLDSDTTVADGSFSLSASTGGIPLSAYLAIVAASYPSTYLYPADPFAADAVGLGVRAISTSSLSLAYFFAGLGVQTPNTGTTVILVADCDGVPIQGATVAFAPAAGALRYLESGTPSPSATATDATGAAMGFNAPPGNTSLSALFNGVSLESHSFVVYSSGLTGTLIHP
ncbi:MAG: hypothetical protein ABIV06_01110 [Thermoanaerobaculia bacterium]